MRQQKLVCSCQREERIKEDAGLLHQTEMTHLRITSLSTVLVQDEIIMTVGEIILVCPPSPGILLCWRLKNLLVGITLF